MNCLLKNYENNLTKCRINNFFLHQETETDNQKYFCHFKSTFYFFIVENFPAILLQGR